MTVRAAAGDAVIVRRDLLQHLVESPLSVSGSIARLLDGSRRLLVLGDVLVKLFALLLNLRLQLFDLLLEVLLAFTQALSVSELSRRDGLQLSQPLFRSLDLRSLELDPELISTYTAP